MGYICWRVGSEILFSALLYRYLNHGYFCSESDFQGLCNGAHLGPFAEIVFSTFCLLGLVTCVDMSFIMVLNVDAV